jgi:hypothetical protein
MVYILADMVFGRGGTNGTVLPQLFVNELVQKIHCNNSRDQKVMICTGIKNQAWLLNEWIYYHLSIGINKIGIFSDNSTDNILEVLQPWGEYIEILTPGMEYNQGKLGQMRRQCYEANKRDFGWIAFTEIDEFLFPLSDECIYDVLKDYDGYGGLSVSYGIFKDAQKLFYKREHETVFEATDFTLGVPAALVKPICNTKYSTGPTRDMPHCCNYSKDYFAVDENFARMGAPGTRCWAQPSPNNTLPRNKIQLSHYQKISLEAALIKYLRDFKMLGAKQGWKLDILAFFQTIFSFDETPVLPDKLALQLMKKRSGMVKHVFPNPAH